MNVGRTSLGEPNTAYFTLTASPEKIRWEARGQGYQQSQGKPNYRNIVRVRAKSDKNRQTPTKHKAVCLLTMCKGNLNICKPR